MNVKIMRLFSACTMAAVLTCTGVAAQAAEAVNTEYADALSISGCATNIKSIYKANYPEQADMIDDIVDTLSSSDEFAAIFDDEGATAFQIIEDSLRDALVPAASTYSLSGGVYKAKKPVPEIRQINGYYCGPASVLMALYGNGDATDSQTNIASALGTTSSNGTYITSISAYMRQKHAASGGYEYKAKAFTCYTYQNAIELVKTSLQQNAVPIIRISDTSVLGYYNGRSQTHYVCISEVNTINKTVTLVDPNNTMVNGKYPYNGTFNISMSEFEDLVNYDGWIALYTKAADGYYVYE